MTRPDHIFIVGLHRTGSTLTRNILNCSRDIGIGGESRFFRIGARLGLHLRPGFRQQFARVGDISTDTGAKKVVDYIFDIPKGFWNLRGKNVDREEFLCRLLESDRSERALLDLAMSYYAKGKSIGGEKTPSHIYFVPTLLKWFPNAKIIHTFRDPRAIYVSNRKKSANKKLSLHSLILRKLGLVFDLYSSSNAILTWSHVVRLHHQYQQLYPDSYYLSRYEDLIADPKTSLQKMCDFLEIDFTEEMLQQTVINSSYLPKSQIKGFDTSAIDRWRRHIDPMINRWFVMWCKQNLLEFGYQP
jgi:Sulfotransferase family